MVTIRKAICHWRLTIVAAQQDCKLSFLARFVLASPATTIIAFHVVDRQAQPFAHAPTSVLNLVLGAPGVSATSLARRRGPPEPGSPRSELEAALEGGDWQRTRNQTSHANLCMDECYLRDRKAQRRTGAQARKVNETAWSRIAS